MAFIEQLILSLDLNVEFLLSQQSDEGTSLSSIYSEKPEVEGNCAENMHAFKDFTAYSTTFQKICPKLHYDQW